MKTFLYKRIIAVLAISLVLSFLHSNKSFAQIINTFPGSTSAGFNTQYGVAVDNTGNVYAADWNSHKLDKITPAGTVTFTTLNGPVGVVFDKAGNKYLTLWDGNLIIRINPQGKVDTLVSGGTAGPEGIAIDPSDTLLYVTDWTSNRVYSVSTTTGKLDTIANKAGTGGGAGDNGPATAATLGGTFGNTLEELAVDAQHNIYIADQGSHRVRVIAGTSTPRHPIVGYIYPFAGTGVAGSIGDGGNATSAQLNSPTGVRVDTAGNVYIADLTGNKIRVVDTAGIIHGFAGTGIAGSTGDGGLALAATFNGPYGLAFDKLGNLYVSEQGSNRIRVITMGTCNVPVINSLTPSQSACVNAANVSFSVAATSTQPMAFQWKRNNTSVGINDSVYNINKVSLTDTGSYTVTVSSFCGAATSSTQAVLTVNRLPVVTITTAMDTVCQGVQVALTASGAPDNYVWLPTATLSDSTGASVLATPALGPTRYTVIGTDVNGCSASAIQTLVAEICTGVDSEIPNDIAIYPNPAGGQLTVSGKQLAVGSTVTITNLLGQSVITQKNNSAGSSTTLDVSHLTEGVYIVTLTANDGSSVSNRFVKE